MSEDLVGKTNRKMKAQLTFDLSDPDDIREHMRCIKSEDMAIALFDLRELFFASNDNKITGQQFVEILESRNIRIEEIII